MTDKTKNKWTETFIKNLPVKDEPYSRSNNGLRIRVYPSGKKSWFFYKVDLSGERTPIPLGEFPAVSLAQARKMATVNQANIYTKGFGLHDNTKGISFKDFIESEQYQSTGRLRPSHVSIMDNLRAIVPKKIQNLPLKAITPTHIEGFIKARLKAGKKKGTINKNITNIRSVFRIAFDKGVLEENIMKKVKTLTDDTATEKLALTKNERKRLIQTAENLKLPQADRRLHLPIYIHLALDTGLRKNELLNLKWSNFRNDHMLTEEVVIQGVKTNYQIPKVVIAEHKKDGDVLTENQLINNYGATKRTLTVFRFYPSIDQTKEDHKNIKELSKALNANGYELKIDDSRNWYVHIPADLTKSSKARSVGVRDQTMKKVISYLGELHKPQWDNRLKKTGYVCDGYDNNLNPLYVEQKDKEKGNVKGYADIGYMQDKLLFPNANNPKVPITSVRKSFETVRNEAGLSKEITPHTLRHEFCTDLIRQGVALTDVQRLAGHSDIKTTMRYVHNLDSKDFTALDRADKRRSRA